MKIQNVMVTMATLERLIKEKHPQHAEAIFQSICADITAQTEELDLKEETIAQRFKSSAKGGLQFKDKHAMTWITKRETPALWALGYALECSVLEKQFGCSIAWRSLPEKCGQLLANKEKQAIEQESRKS